jgi:NAD(P)-dependent dehydrogenase (short-subunit alcohol dehydrogenase family)
MTNPFFLDGRVAFISGASSGLGHHFAVTLARAGAKVALGARRVDRLQDVVAEIEGFDGRALAVALDVTDSDNVREAVAAAETELGPISILVNNAGVSGGAKRAIEVEEAEWLSVIDVNLNGVWRMAQEVAKHMVRLGHGGSIINIASMLGLVAVPYIPAYCASKAAVVNLTRALAIELAKHDIRVNAIAPGYFESEMTHDFLGSTEGRSMIDQIPQRRSGDPAELDGALLLLASDASSYMTGTVLTVDGGHTLVIPSR